MHRQQRLRKTRDFAATRSYGRSYSDNLLVLVARPNKLDVTRFGFSVGRRVGKAVVRNKIKRRLREVARLTAVDAGWDLVLIARKGASAAGFKTLGNSAARLFARGRVLSAPPGVSNGGSKDRRCENRCS